MVLQLYKHVFANNAQRHDNLAHLPPADKGLATQPARVHQAGATGGSDSESCAASRRKPPGCDNLLVAWLGGCWPAPRPARLPSADRLKRGLCRQAQGTSGFQPFCPAARCRSYTHTGTPWRSVRRKRTRGCAKTPQLGIRACHGRIMQGKTLPCVAPAFHIGNRLADDGQEHVGIVGLAEIELAAGLAAAPQ